MLPSVLKLQETLFPLKEESEADIERLVEGIRVILPVAVQPFASVIVTIKVPAPSPLKSCVVAPLLQL